VFSHYFATKKKNFLALFACGLALMLFPPLPRSVQHYSNKTDHPQKISGTRSIECEPREQPGKPLDEQ
jgi:hypothetical protein